MPDEDDDEDDDEYDDDDDDDDDDDARFDYTIDPLDVHPSADTDTADDIRRVDCFAWLGQPSRAETRAMRRGDDDAITVTYARAVVSHRAVGPHARRIVDVDIAHTWTPPNRRGRGLARDVVLRLRDAVTSRDDCDARRAVVRASCSFARRTLETTTTTTPTTTRPWESRARNARRVTVVDRTNAS